MADIDSMISTLPDPDPAIPQPSPAVPEPPSEPDPELEPDE